MSTTQFSAVALSADLVSFPFGGVEAQRGLHQGWHTFSLWLALAHRIKSDPMDETDGEKKKKKHDSQLAASSCKNEGNETVEIVEMLGLHH